MAMEIQAPEYWDMLIKRAVSRFFLLSALHQRPMHGYEIGKSIKGAYSGCCEPSDAMIYPALRELLEGGYIECRTEATGGRKRKICALTEKGVEAYRVAAEAWRRAVPHLSEAIAAGIEERAQSRKKAKGG